MILLLGKNNAIERYAKEILHVDMGNDIVYYPNNTTHYSEIPLWIELAKKEQPEIISTQNIEMLNAFMESDLDFQVITAFDVDGKLSVRILSKEKALFLQTKMGMDLR